MSAPHVLAEVKGGIGWLHVARTSIAIVALLAACAEEAMPLLGSDPNYSMVFFDSGSSTLGKQARQKLSDDVLKPSPPIKAVLRSESSAKICVTGHADNTGSEVINKEIGQRRADAVAKYLVELGAPQQRIVVGTLGSSKPLVVVPPNTPVVTNRRVEVVFGCDSAR
jgi:outer membrane protein OmpA-like peptidoglycan-associated protein